MKKKQKKIIKTAILINELTNEYSVNLIPTTLWTLARIFWATNKQKKS